MKASRQPSQPSRFDRFFRLWKRIFFWQTPSPSEEVAPTPHADHALVIAVTKPKAFSVWRQLRFVNYLFNASERRQFWGATLVGLALVLTSAGLLLKPHFLTIPGSGGRLTEGLIGTPRLINPLYPSTEADQDLTRLLYSGLFRLDNQLQPQPDLAEKYRWLDNNRTLEVTLRQDARFHDGLLVTSDDVIFTMQAIKNPAWRSLYFSTFKDVNVIRIDDQTVQFQTETPNLTLPFSLSVGILPAHVWEEVAESTARLADANLKPIGSGPYRFDSFTRDSKGSILSYHLKRFDAYYGQKPLLDGWDFRFYPDRDQAEKGLQNNQIDTLSFVPWNEVTALKLSDRTQKQVELPQSTTLFFNVTDPVLKELPVRQAFDLAIDRNELKATVGEHAQLLQGPYPFLEFSNPSSTMGDLEKARTLINNAGWTLTGDASIRQRAKAKTTTPKSKGTTVSSTSTDVEETGTRLALTLTVPDQADLLVLASFLKRRWALLGADISIEPVKTAELRQRIIKNQPTQLVLWNVLLTSQQDIAPFWHSDPASEAINISHFSSKTLDKALDAVTAATSTALRLQAQQTVSKAITEQTPAVFLLRPSLAYILPHTVQGSEDLRIGNPADRFLHTLKWYIKTTWKWQ